MSKINKVLYNVDQTSDTTAAERRMARKNIGLDDILGVASTAYDTGIAPLGNNGLVPVRYLPSFVDEVVSGYYYNSKFYEEASHTTEITPDSNKIYVDMTDPDASVAYRWSGTVYVQISTQNTFGRISDGTAIASASGPMDTLNVVGGNGLSASVNNVNDHATLTITHPVGNAASITGYPTADATPSFGDTFTVSQVVTDSTSHVYSMTSRTIRIPNITARSGNDGNVNGLMSWEDKAKLDGLQIFSSVTDGSNIITANSSSAALSLVAGSNISIVLDPTDREITIGATSSVSYRGFDTPQDPYPHNKAMTLNDYRYILGSYITLEGVNDYGGQNDSRRFYLAPGRFTIGSASYRIDDILTQIPDYGVTDYNLRVLGIAKNSGEPGYNQPGPTWMTVPGQIREVQITDDTQLNKARNYLMSTNWLPYTIFDTNREVMCYPSRCYGNGTTEKYLDFIGIEDHGGYVVICSDEYKFYQGLSHAQAVYKVYDTDISGVYGQAANTIYFL